MLEGYYKEKEKRREQGLPALPLNAEQVQAIADLFESGEGSDELLILLENEVPPGVCLLYTSPSPRDLDLSRMPSSA